MSPSSPLPYPRDRDDRVSGSRSPATPHPAASLLPRRAAGHPLLPCSPLLPGSGSPTSPRALSRPDPAHGASSAPPPARIWLSNAARATGDGKAGATPWPPAAPYRLGDALITMVSRFEGPPESVQEIIDTAQHTSRLGRLATRMRARRLQREADNPPDGGSTAPDSGLPGNNASDPSRHGSSPLSPEGIDLLQRLTLIGLANTERLATAVSDLRRISAPSQYGASASSSNPPNPEPTVDGTHVAAAPSADQASNSSTIAVIQGDAGISESAGEPSNAGSSRSLRRRGRSNALGSLDVDGGGLQRNKRRRMN